MFISSLQSALVITACENVPINTHFKVFDSMCVAICTSLCRHVSTVLPAELSEVRCTRYPMHRILTYLGTVQYLRVQVSKKVPIDRRAYKLSTRLSCLMFSCSAGHICLRVWTEELKSAKCNGVIKLRLQPHLV